MFYSTYLLLEGREVLLAMHRVVVRDAAYHGMLPAPFRPGNFKLILCRNIGPWNNWFERSARFVYFSNKCAGLSRVGADRNCDKTLGGACRGANHHLLGVSTHHDQPNLR